MSETLYNVNYYDSLMLFINHSMKPDGLVFIGTKTYYFGLGGGYYEFKKYIEERTRDMPYSLEILEKINDMKSIERLVLVMRRLTEE